MHFIFITASSSSVRKKGISKSLTDTILKFYNVYYLEVNLEVNLNIIYFYFCKFLKKKLFLLLTKITPIKIFLSFLIKY